MGVGYKHLPNRCVENIQGAYLFILNLKKENRFFLLVSSTSIVWNTCLKTWVHFNIWSLLYDRLYVVHEMWLELPWQLNWKLYYISLMIGKMTSSLKLIIWQLSFTLGRCSLVQPRFYSKWRTKPHFSCFSLHVQRSLFYESLNLHSGKYFDHWLLRSLYLAGYISYVFALERSGPLSCTPKMWGFPFLHQL